ncbi:MAG: hypothetical protein ACMUIM_11605 [bacterium]
MNEIDAGRSVILHLSGHMMLGIGYYLSTETVLVHDTWNNSNLVGPLTMPRGGTYQYPDGIIFTHYAVTWMGRSNRTPSSVFYVRVILKKDLA